VLQVTGLLRRRPGTRHGGVGDAAVPLLLQRLGQSGAHRFAQHVVAQHWLQTVASGGRRAAGSETRR
jgi:hypothetical protein